MNVRVAAPLLAILLDTSGVASAQRLAGAVRDPAGQPIASAVVSLRSTGGEPLDRTVTDRQGTFILPVVGTARTVNIIRIGFLPVTVPVPDSAQRTRASIMVTMQPVPRVLEPILVVDAKCPKDGTAGVARALWEQARSGFLASVVAREAAPPDAEVLHFVRTVGPLGNVMRTTVNAIRATSTRPILAARSPSMFVTAGYVDDSPSGRQYYGPDADVLLDAAFSASHCFSIAKADRAHPDQAGIAFAPALGRELLSDIKGVLWLDRAPLALRALDFFYTGLEPAVEKAQGGGHLSFRSADNGTIVIDRYDLRMPEFQFRSIDFGGRTMTPLMTPAAVANTPRSAHLGVVNGVHGSGGVLVSATWPDGTTLATPLPTLTGKVTNAAGHGLPAIDVAIPWTIYRAKTGADGSFSIPDVVPGEYPVSAFDSSLAVFGVVRSRTMMVTVPVTQKAPFALVLDTVTTAIRKACEPKLIGSGGGAIAVVVTDSSGKPVPSDVSVVLLPSTIPPSDLDREIQRLLENPDNITLGGFTVTSGGGPAVLCGAKVGVYLLTASDSTRRHGGIAVHVAAGSPLDTARIVIRRSGPPLH